MMAVYRLHRGIDARVVASAHELALGLEKPGFRVFVDSGAIPFEPSDCQELAVDAISVLQRRAPSLVAEFERRGWALPAKINRGYSPSEHMLKTKGPKGVIPVGLFLVHNSPDANIKYIQQINKYHVSEMSAWCITSLIRIGLGKYLDNNNFHIEASNSFCFVGKPLIFSGETN